MKPELRPIGEQVLVITGASSGIGLVTARLAAERGASVVLCARNERDLTQAVDSIRAAGGRASHYVADVADESQVRALADFTVQEHGRIDTWVNNAAVALYGRLAELPTGDMRRQFEVNYWGAVHGSLAAIAHLRERGGALINVASAVADRAIPLQGNYCAAKHALKAFTETLRMELEEEGVPISVTLVKPASVDTPLFDKARTYEGVEARPVAPVYAPEVVARAILSAAERPVRDVVVGGMGRVIGLGHLVPRFTDRYMEKHTFDDQLSDVPLPAERRDNLYEPVAHDGGERGRNWNGRVRKTSAYTAAALHPARAAIVGAAVAVGVFVGARRLFHPNR